MELSCSLLVALVMPSSGQQGNQTNLDCSDQQYPRRWGAWSLSQQGLQLGEGWSCPHFGLAERYINEASDLSHDYGLTPYNRLLLNGC